MAPTPKRPATGSEKHPAKEKSFLRLKKGLPNPAKGVSSSAEQPNMTDVSIVLPFAPPPPSVFLAELPRKGRINYSVARRVFDSKLLAGAQQEASQLTRDEMTTRMVQYMGQMMVDLNHIYKKDDAIKASRSCDVEGSLEQLQNSLLDS